MQRQGYKLQNYTKFEGYTCFLQGLNNGQNPFALIKKHPVYVVEGQLHSFCTKPLYPYEKFSLSLNAIERKNSRRRINIRQIN